MRKNSIYKREGLVAKRLKARYLIVVHGLSNSEAAKEVSISPKTISLWSTRYKWNDLKAHGCEAIGGMHIYFGQFLLYVRSNNLSLHKELVPLWERFLEKQKTLYDFKRDKQKLH